MFDHEACRRRRQRPRIGIGIHANASACSRITRMVRLACRFLLLSGAGLLVPVDLATGQPPTLTAAERALHLKAFDQVWETVRDKHWDPKLDGLDWEAIRKEYRPKVEQAKTAEEVRLLLKAMLGQLKKSHYNIIPATAYQDIQGGTNDPHSNDKANHRRFVTGLDIRVVQDQALVVGVDEGLPADKLRVRPGWIVLRVRGEELSPILKRVGESFKDSKRLQRELTGAVHSRLRGHQGEKVPVVFRDGNDREVRLEIPVTVPRGVPYQFGNTPPAYVHFQSRTLEGNIGYFALNAFFDPLRIMKAFEQAVRDARNSAGFIVDLRGNPGGIGLMAVGLGNWFISGEQYKLGTLYMRDSHINFILNPRPETYRGPLAILVDGLSGSTSEIMAGGLQDLKRARIFGTPTMGAALPSVFDRLPTGDGFQYAIANYISTGGQVLEGRGVQPDVIVWPDRAALLQGRDPVIEAAVQWIRSQQKK